MTEENIVNMDVVDAKEVGLDPDRLLRLKGAIEKDTADGTNDGAVFIVARGGKIAMHEAVGKTDLAKDRAAKLEDIFFLFSLTKQITAVRVLMDIEAGKFALTTPVADVIDGFGIKGKQRVTVGHLLTHTSGLNTEMPFMLPLDKFTEIEAVTAAVANERILSTPGKMVSYNPTTAHAVLAVMVQRLDEKNRPFRQILAEDLFEPLGMKDTALGLPDRFKDRLVPVVVRDRTPGIFEPDMLEAMNFLATETTEFPSGGGVSTVQGIFLFTEMLSLGGALNGVRILSPEMVSLATTNHTGTMSNHLFDYMREVYGWPDFPAYIGLTFFLRGEGVFPMPFGIGASPGTFGGLGAGSTMFWVDPEKDLTFVFLTAGLMEEGKNFMRFQRLSDMVIASVVD